MALDTFEHEHKHVYSLQVSQNRTSYNKSKPCLRLPQLTTTQLVLVVLRDSLTQKIEIGVVSEEERFWLRRVKLFSTHYKMIGEKLKAKRSLETTHE